METEPQYKHKRTIAAAISPTGVAPKAASGVAAPAANAAVGVASGAASHRERFFVPLSADDVEEPQLL